MGLLPNFDCHRNSRFQSCTTLQPLQHIVPKMSSIGTGYDLSASQFSPDGRVFQVEYAQKAVENSGTSIALKGKDGVVFAVEKLVTSKLYEMVLTGESSVLILTLEWLLLDYLLIPGRSLKLPEKKPPITVANMVATFLSSTWETVLPCICMPTLFIPLYDLLDAQ